MPFDRDAGDHVHPIGRNNAGKLEPITQFDYNEIDRNAFGNEPEESGVPLADMSAALMLLLQWVCGKGSSLVHAGARAEALMYWLNPGESRFATYSDIAKEAGITRAAISKMMLSLRDQSGVCMPVSKLNSSRETYRKSQLLAVKEGRHASVKTKKQK
jgi:hypothetical protein